MQFNKPSDSSPENPAEERFKIPSKEKTLPKDTLKQQQKDTAVVASSKGFELLRDAGFDEPTARRLASVATAEQINQQIAWLPRRNPDHNRLGMLRRAIEEKWSAPDQTREIKTVLRERRERDRERANAEERENKRLSVQKQQRIRQQSELKALWDGLSSDEQLQIEKQAYQNLPGEMLRQLFVTRESHRLRGCLAELNRQLNADDSAKSS